MKFFVNKEDLKLETLLIGGADVSLDIKEGMITKYKLPIFEQLEKHVDLSDNIVEDSCFGNPGVSLNLLDLSGSEFLSNSDLSNNWLINDDDWKTLDGDILYYEAVLNGIKIPKADNWVTFDNGEFIFNPKQENVGTHSIVLNAYDKDGHENVKSKVISVNVKDVNVININSISDISIKEGYSGSFTLPEFSELSSSSDLSDNIINSSDSWGLDLSLNDLSGNDLSGNWIFFDSDFSSEIGDKLFYSATIDGVKIPQENNWITFRKGTFNYTPFHENVGVHIIVVSATDLSDNVSSVSFKLTVEDLHIRNKLTDKEMFTNEVLEVKLSEFGLMVNDLSDNIFQVTEGANTFYGLDLSLNDLSNNNLWDLSNNDLSGNDWNFFDPSYGTSKGDKVVYKAYINGIVIGDEIKDDQFSTFKNGVLKFTPGHNDNGSYKIKIVTVDLSDNETSQEFTLLVKSKYVKTDLEDRNVDEGKTLEFMLEEFKLLSSKYDLSDNIIFQDGKWGLDLSLNDLSSNGLWDLSNNDLSGNDLSGNDLSWNFFDTEFGTNNGDISMYEVKMDGEVLPIENNWATFNRGKFVFSPEGKHIGDHTVVVTTIDLSGNEAEQKFKLTVNAVVTPYVRSKFYGNNIGLKLNYSSKINEVITFTLPEFESMNCSRFENNLVQDFQKNDGIRLKKSDLSSYDTPSNFTDKWVFFDPSWLTSEGDDLFYTAKIDDVTIPRENNWITFKNGKFVINPTKLNSGDHKITIFAYDLLSNFASIDLNLNVNSLPVINDIKVILNTNELYEAVISASDVDGDSVTLSVDNLPSWLTFNSITNVLSGTPTNNDTGIYKIKVTADDGNGVLTSREFNLVVIRICNIGEVSFEKGVVKDILQYGNTVDFVKAINLKFINRDAKCVDLIYTAFKTANGGYVLELEFGEEYKDYLVELEIVTTFRPMFFKYKGNRLIKLTDMDDLSTFEPNRWASEKILKEDLESGDIEETHRTLFQGYLRDIHMNAGCVSEDFDAGICEDPHILTFGGNRLDLPHNDHIYNMINGLGLKINVKSQILGDGSYAKYFYVNYQGEDFIIDVDDLNIKRKENRVKTKYHMLETIDYNGNNFIFEKKMRSLIVRTTDGVMELLFNAETRGLLIKSRLDFTQENSTGIMMSNYVDECKLIELSH